MAADLTAAVPSFPGWNVGQLVSHLGGAQRWVADIVRTQSTEPLPDVHFRDLSAFTDHDPDVVGAWLGDSAEALVDALRQAGPDAPVSTGPISDGTAKFYARRSVFFDSEHSRPGINPA